jgi:hypothetical protein
MNVKSLKHNLELLGVKAKEFSLNGEFKNDAIVLEKAHRKFGCKVHYIDERATISETNNFRTLEEACAYIYALFKKAKDVENSQK